MRYYKIVTWAIFGFVLSLEIVGFGRISPASILADALLAAIFLKMVELVMFFKGNNGVNGQNDAWLEDWQEPNKEEEHRIT